MVKKGPGSVSFWLPEGSNGEYKITHFEVSQRDSDFTRLRAAVGHTSEFVKPDKYTKLTNKNCWSPIMSDTDMEWNTNYRPREQSKGRVLMAGLGIGFIVKEVVERVEVTEVVVVEKSPEVVSLVEPHLRKALGEMASKLKIIICGIEDFYPSKEEKFDCIYVDIWGEQSEDDVTYGEQLCRRLRKNQVKGGWTDFWDITR